MRKIRIDVDVMSVAAAFKQQLDVHKTDVLKALDNLLNGLDGTHNVSSKGGLLVSGEVSKFHQYVEKLRNEYDGERFTLMKPDNYEHVYNEYKAILKDAELKLKISIGGDEAKNLHKRITEAMGYQKYVRDDIYPMLMWQMGIKACVYCNANYTVATERGVGYFELDHWKPESKYPFLCTSFYNLQPSCPHCNKHKSSDTNGEYLKLYEEDPNADLDVFEFVIPKGSLVRYFNSQDTSHIRVKFKAKDASQEALRNKANEKFGIESIYNEHIDVIEEMMWRAKFYDSAIVSSMVWLFGKRRPVVDIARFKLGTYAGEDEIHRRPLTKMMQDVGKQLELI